MIIGLREKRFLANPLVNQHFLDRNSMHEYCYLGFQANGRFEVRALTSQLSQLSGEHSSSIEKHELVRFSNFGGELGEDSLYFDKKNGERFHPRDYS